MWYRSCCIAITIAIFYLRFLKSCSSNPLPFRTCFDRDFDHLNCQLTRTTEPFWHAIVVVHQIKIAENDIGICLHGNKPQSFKSLHSQLATHTHHHVVFNFISIVFEKWEFRKKKIGRHSHNYNTNQNGDHFHVIQITLEKSQATTTRLRNITSMTFKNQLCHYSAWPHFHEYKIRCAIDLFHEHTPQRRRHHNVVFVNFEREPMLKLYPFHRRTPRSAVHHIRSTIIFSFVTTTDTPKV